MKKTQHYDASSAIQDLITPGIHGGVNPAINDSATYTFPTTDKMTQAFSEEMEGIFLYSRHWNPSNKHLCQALAKLEGTESAKVMASGMAAITCTLLQLCQQGDEIIASNTIYGGTYALLKHVLPRFGIQTHFVNIKDIASIRDLTHSKTKVIYTESMSNPLLGIADIPTLSKLAHDHQALLVVDNTFTPLILSPHKLGADIVIHSITKYINGMADCVAGCVCSDKKFINELTDINHGLSMLFGPVLDSLRASNILKNLHTLHIRMQKHSENTQFLAEKMSECNCRVIYPGLRSHPDYELFQSMMNANFGYGGMLVIDMQNAERAKQFITQMQHEKVGLLAVSLGYFKTLFSMPCSSTSSEIPLDEQEKMGLDAGLIRLSVGLDHDIERTFLRIKKCLDNL